MATCCFISLRPIIADRKADPVTVNGRARIRIFKRGGRSVRSNSFTAITSLRRKSATARKNDIKNIIPAL